MTDREKLIELLTAYYGADPAYYDVDAPSIADHLLAHFVVVREKGEWIWDKRHGNHFCSRCGAYDMTIPNFCRNCGRQMQYASGADMRKGENG